MKTREIIKESSKVSEYKTNINVISFHAYKQKLLERIMEGETSRNVPKQ